VGHRAVGHRIVEVVRGILTFAMLIATICGPARAAEDMRSSIGDLERQWAQISYQTPEAEQKAKFKVLTQQAEDVVKKFPGRAEPLAWQAMVLCSYAEAIGGLAAFDNVKRAHDLLLQAAKIDDTGMGGTIYGYLGTLYSKVPGWPIGFGDDKKAQSYFQKALAVDPEGLDANYLYGHYLVDTGKKDQARPYLLKARNLPPRPDHAEYDAGRRQDIEADLVKIK
jgi:tetratricopeptide (TPR) repeat protein